jgi:hypothetical protein
MFSLFFIVFFAVAVGIALAVFATRQQLPGGAQLVPPEEDFDKDPKDKQPLALDDLYKLGDYLCKENGLVVKDRIVNGNNEVYWVAESKNEFFFGNYVLGFVETNQAWPFITMHDILEFKDFIKSVGSTKGFFFTTGYYTRDVHQPLEGPKVTLYNRLKVLDELKSHSLSH